MTADITTAVWNSGVLMSVHVRRPPFHRRNRPVDLLIDNMNREVMDPGFKKMIAPSALKKLTMMEARARNALYLRSTSFTAFSESRFVANGTLGKILRELEQVKIEFDAEVEVLVAAYPQLKQDALTLLDAESHKMVISRLENLSGDTLTRERTRLFEWFEQQCVYHRTLYEHWEKGGDLRQHFGMDWSVGRITLEGMENLDVSASVVSDMQDKFKANMESWVRDATASMHRVLGEKAAHAKELLEKQGKLNARNLRPFFEALQAFKDLDFTGTSDFRKTVDDIYTRFGVQKDGDLSLDLSADAISQSQTSFAEMLTSISTLATQDVAQQAGLKALANSGQFDRVMDL